MGQSMKLSTDRILTTHVGSLPRPANVLDFLTKKDRGEPFDPTAFDACMAGAVTDVVAAQVDAGIDIVSDGELSKIGYATYLKDRLEGFSGDSPRKAPADLLDYPSYLERLASSGQSPKINRPRCTGPITVKDDDGLAKDIANFKAAVADNDARDGFLNTASPGVIAVFQPNEYYPTYAAYLEALADAMKAEYTALYAAGVVLQVDCPDLAMGRHIMFSDESDDAFIANAELQIEALNHALADVPAEACRLHLCWGNYEGPHTHDIGLEKIIDVILKAKPMAISFEASNPRHAHEWEVWRDARLPDDKVLIPGVIDSATNFVEHPRLVAQRIGQFAAIVGRERVIAVVDCGFATFAGFGKIDPAICYAKLKTLSEGAAIASADLY